VDRRDLEAGQAIDGFRLVEPLEPGGMAHFWRVTRDGNDLPMLMKIPLLRPGEDPLTIVGYEVEQMILPRLSGPHVPRFVAAGDFERPYIVTEFVAGQSLKLLLQKTPLSADETATIGAKIAFALHDIHRQHVIHLDLKPSNVILRGDDAVLIDFGLAHHDQLPDLVSEEAEGPVGTGAYIAPEQVLGDRTGPRSDFFALGVIMSWRQANGHLASRNSRKTGADGFGATPSPRGCTTLLCRRGCKRSSCAAWKSIPKHATQLPLSLPLISAIRTTSPLQPAPSGSDATVS
jgi:serine/threonine protein kinase